MFDPMAHKRNFSWKFSIQLVPHCRSSMDVPGYGGKSWQEQSCQAKAKGLRFDDHSWNLKFKIVA